MTEQDRLDAIRQAAGVDSEDDSDDSEDEPDPTETTQAEFTRRAREATADDSDDEPDPTDTTQAEFTRLAREATTEEQDEADDEPEDQVIGELEEEESEGFTEEFQEEAEDRFAEVETEEELREEAAALFDERIEEEITTEDIRLEETDDGLFQPTLRAERVDQIQRSRRDEIRDLIADDIDDQLPSEVTAEDIQITEDDEIILAGEPIDQAEDLLRLGAAQQVAGATDVDATVRAMEAAATAPAIQEAAAVDVDDAIAEQELEEVAEAQRDTAVVSEIEQFRSEIITEVAEETGLQPGAEFGIEQVEVTRRQAEILSRVGEFIESDSEFQAGQEFLRPELTEAGELALVEQQLEEEGIDPEQVEITREDDSFVIDQPTREERFLSPVTDRFDAAIGRLEGPLAQAVALSPLTQVGAVGQNATSAVSDRIGITSTEDVIETVAELDTQQAEQFLFGPDDADILASPPPVTPARQPVADATLARDVAVATGAAAGLFAVTQEIDIPGREEERQELAIPEDQVVPGRELEVGEQVTATEIEVPADSVQRISAGELGIPEDVMQDATIRGPDGVDITDDGDIIVPIGVTQVAAGTRLDEEEDEEDEEEEEEEEVVEEDEIEGIVVIELPETGEDILDEEEIPDTGTREEVEEAEEPLENGEAEEIVDIIPLQRQAEDEIDPEDIRAEEEFVESPSEIGDEVMAEEFMEAEISDTEFVDESISGPEAPIDTTAPALAEEELTGTADFVDLDIGIDAVGMSDAELAGEEAFLAAEPAADTVTDAATDIATQPQLTQLPEQALVPQQQFVQPTTTTTVEATTPATQTVALSTGLSTRRRLLRDDLDLGTSPLAGEELLEDDIEEGFEAPVVTPEEVLAGEPEPLDDDLGV